jgi:glycosyltransferase involved in cell wall biosynthesis
VLYYNVILVVEKEITNERKDLGFKLPDLSGVIAYLMPDYSKIKELISSDSIHIFSGINHNRTNKIALKLLIKSGGRFGIMAEPYNWIGLRGIFNFIRHKHYFYKYGCKSDFLLGIGHKATELYRKVGYEREKIFDWGYFVEDKNSKFLNNHNSKFEIVYLGRLSKEKGLVFLIESLRNLKLNYHLEIIGSGVLKRKLETLIKEFKLDTLVTIKEKIPNEIVQDVLVTKDLMILPSTGKDGWGAVVNEALMVGTPVLCSEFCGASVLLKDYWRGGCFNPRRKEDLIELLSNTIENNSHFRCERERIMHWAKDRITGPAASLYFKQIINFIYNAESERPRAPWLT